MTKPDQPVLPIQLNLFQKLAFLTGAALVLVQWAIVFREYPGLPEIIPSHFNGAGEVDGHSGKGFLYLLPSVTTVLFVIMAVLYRFPNSMNYPVQVTEENAAALYRMSINLLAYISLVISGGMLLLPYYNHSSFILYLLFSTDES